MDLLGDKNQDMTLEQVLRFVEAKEAGKRSVSRLLLLQAVTGSSYRRQKRPSAKGPPKNQDTCTYCGARGHGRNPPTRVRRNECPAYGTKCNHCGKDHHVFDNFTKERRSKPQPYIRLQMSIRWEDYNHFGFPLRVPQQRSFVSAMADTGSQSCLVGLKIVKKLGLSTRDLIPVDIKMHAADNRDIHILGATILRLSGKNNKGKE